MIGMGVTMVTQRYLCLQFKQLWATRTRRSRWPVGVAYLWGKHVRRNGIRERAQAVGRGKDIHLTRILTGSHVVPDAP